MNKERITEMIQAATNAVSKYGDGKNHTIGAAVATKDGKIITGVNLFHFTGGPCGEIVAIANAISSGEKDLAAIVAIGDKGRGVLASCGRCRQVLFDYYPDMFVIIAKGSEHVAKPVRDMLPDVYDWRAQQVEGNEE